ncbi:MAG: AsnC family transcriptional regulator [Rhodobacteraceae bacterium]|nr:AsnC family transcriptional regulator [Paracoccaceae bacterium]MAY47107.1 AsnC family transcriptional regulator [Paracoccaceae bacterium]
MDETDERILGTLRRNARMSLSDMSHLLGLSRTTLRTRIERMERDGVIQGYTVVLKQDVAQDPVRGLMMLGIEGRGADRILRQLQGMAEVRAVHSTNGRWDLIAEIGTDTLEGFDAVLARIRRLDGVSTSETSLLLRTSRAR